MKIIISFILCFFLCFQAASGLPVDQLSTFPDEDFPLRKNNSWEGSDSRLELLPEVEGSAAIRNRFQSFQPEVAIERLYRVPLLQKYKQPGIDGKQPLFLDILNSFGKPETQIGYTYHSATRDKDIVLFEECYISDRKGREQEGFFFSVDRIPEEFSYYQYVDEANFSGTVLKQNIVITEDSLSNNSINEDSLWFTIFPVIGKGELRGEVFLFPSGDYLYIYSCTQVEKEPAVKKIGVPMHLPSMFGKRMDVMVEWLYDSLSKE